MRVLTVRHSYTLYRVLTALFSFKSTLYSDSLINFPLLSSIIPLSKTKLIASKKIDTSGRQDRSTYVQSTASDFR